MCNAHLRGHRIIYIDNQWVYADTKELANYDRPCSRCGRMPTKEGYDACIKEIPGAIGACCGHGIGNNYVMMENKYNVGIDK